MHGVLLSTQADTSSTQHKFPETETKKCLQSTPFSPMDISPQGDASGATSAPTPPPQPQFTPQPSAPANTCFEFSFGTSTAQLNASTAGPKPSPRGRKHASKAAADLPKSRFFMPPNASDSSTHAAGAPGFGGFAQAPGFGSFAQAQPSTSSEFSGTARFAVPQPNGLTSQHGGTQTPPNGFFTSGTARPTTAFLFQAAGRPMDSRIPEACATDFMGINLDSIPAQAASSRPPNAAPAATAGLHAGSAQAFWQQPPAPAFPSQPAACTTSTEGSRERANDDDSGAPTGLPPSWGAAFAGIPFAAAGNQQPTAEQAAPPSLFSFTMGTAATPKQQSPRPIFATEHLATNLHDKLVLEAGFTAAPPSSNVLPATATHVVQEAAGPPASGPVTSQMPCTEQQQKQAERSAADSAAAAVTAAASDVEAAAVVGRQADGPASDYAESTGSQQSSAQPQAAAASVPFVFTGVKGAAAQVQEEDRRRSPQGTCSRGHKPTLPQVRTLMSRHIQHVLLHTL